MTLRLGLLSLLIVVWTACGTEGRANRNIDIGTATVGGETSTEKKSETLGNSSDATDKQSSGSCLALLKDGEEDDDGNDDDDDDDTAPTPGDAPGDGTGDAEMPAGGSDSETDTGRCAGALTYEDSIKSITSVCAGCHSGANASAGIALDSKDNLVKNFTQAIKQITSGAMPLGGTPLSADAQKTLAAWEAAGFP